MKPYRIYPIFYNNISFYFSVPPYTYTNVRTVLFLANVMAVIANVIVVIELEY